MWVWLTKAISETKFEVDRSTEGISGLDEMGVFGGRSPFGYHF